MRTIQMTASAIALMTLSGAALAERPDYYNDRARVLSATPIYQQVNQPRQQCSVETVGGGYREAPRNYGGALIGGVVGGLLGNTVGGGNGRTAAAAVGAVAGALVGDNISGRNRGGYYEQGRQVERCRTVDNYRQVAAGYNVVYRYHGRDMRTTLPYNPGRFIDVNVAVQRNEQQNYRDVQYGYGDAQYERGDARHDYGDARQDGRSYRQVGYRGGDDGRDD
ncbi:glycine zipper 2TM domain-containing protein [Sulfuriferula sp.]|uniref:glycine zipper 2TM domain-containing protein n=1 Tax=Sulfuriferula sp. TaxID=2025307 RepID=UPI002731B131|nr:glycine zipper 2TM domain-containing protein [Sulfuriferula sp.]MDP2024683.1 glycine zipper 2TM domain-containing protein [Sulfuriferula sp.]